MTYIRLHWKKLIVIALLFVVFMGRFQYKMPKRNFADFHVNYYTGKRVLAGKNVYDLAGYRKDGMANFKYPPLFAAIAALFALTSERVAASIWFSLGFLLVIVFMYFAGKLIVGDRLTYKQRQWVYFWSLFLTSRFYMQNFDEGQVNFLMMTTLLLGIYFLSKGKTIGAALLFGFSMLVKYMSFVFVPYFIAKRRFKIIIYSFAAIVFFSFLPVLVWGWSHNLFLQKQFFPYVCQTSLDVNSLSDYANQSVYSAILRYFSPFSPSGINIVSLSDKTIGILFLGIGILFYSLILLPAKSKQFFDTKLKLNLIDISMVFFLAALFNPNAWMHAYIFMTFGYMTLITYLIQVKLKDRWVIMLVFLSFFFHSCSGAFFTRWWAGDTFEYLSFVTIGGLVAFAGLLKIKFKPLIENRSGLHAG